MRQYVITCVVAAGQTVDYSLPFARRDAQRRALAYRMVVKVKSYVQQRGGRVFKIREEEA